MTGSLTPFALHDPLPTGTLVIEASAGTGKTFTLATLVARLIAERGVPAAEILIVTFTRAAAAELQGRVRSKLVEVAAVLAVDDDEVPEGMDRWLHELRTDRPDERRRRAQLIERAITEFDAMTVTTIHAFASQVLGTLGTTAGTDPDIEMVGSDGQLLHQACDDVLAAASAEGYAADVLPKATDLRRDAGTADGLPDVVLIPTETDEGAQVEDVLLADLVRRVRTTVADRRRRRNSMAFSDVLVRLRDALVSEDGGAAIEALRTRFSVALIDEFQDTDVVQWEIFSTLFDTDDHRSLLVLVGDPKQSIYSFRGADIHAYTDATTPRPGLTVRSLATNWRSDAALLTALNTLFEGTTFGAPTIGYVDVHPEDGRGTGRMTIDGAAIAPLLLRLATGADIEHTKRSGELQADAAREATYADLSRHVVALLSGARLPDPSLPEGRAVRPDDIAVLVTTGSQGAEVAATLARHDVPVVLSRGPSVLTSPAADHWRSLLLAMGSPTDLKRARSFALTPFGGYSPEDVAAFSDEDLADIQEQLRTWADLLPLRGVTAWRHAVMAQSDVVARVLAQPDGDRMITDLEHVGELLGAAAVDRASVASLLASLVPDPDGSNRVDNDPAARRVETDQPAVQVMTIWNAKGLEFPIVCVPTLWRTPYKSGIRSIPVLYRDPETGRRTFDVATSNWPTKRARDERFDRAKREALGSDLRLLYVALTRAKHHLAVWWASVQDSSNSALDHVLFCRDGDGALDESTFAELPVARGSVPQTIEKLANRAPGLIAVSEFGAPGEMTLWVDGGSGPDATVEVDRPELTVATVDRPLDRRRSRWSFTAVTRHVERDEFDPFDPNLADGGAHDEAPEMEGTPVTGGTTAVVPISVPTTESEPSLTALPAGAEFGNLVHGIFEGVDFEADDLPGDLERRLGDIDRLGRIDLSVLGSGRERARHENLLFDGLVEAIHTPLGDAFGDVRLRDIPAGRRLNELSFELLLATTGRPATLTDIGHLIERHLASNDALAPWAASLADGPASLDLAGHLTGSIDLVLRLDDGRFVVADYKTNRLTRAGRVFDPDDYGRAAMARSMAEHHYPLQALLYSVALHRYLRWRLDGYSPERHLGGAAYLYVRGMAGPNTPCHDGHRNGVFDWSIPPALVEDLSDLLDGTAGPA